MEVQLYYRVKFCPLAIKYGKKYIGVSNQESNKKWHLFSWISNKIAHRDMIFYFVNFCEISSLVPKTQTVFVPHCYITHTDTAGICVLT